MAATPLTIRPRIEAELLIRIKGSDALHLVGTFQYETDISVVLQGATGYTRNT